MMCKAHITLTLCQSNIKCVRMHADFVNVLTTHTVHDPSCKLGLCIQNLELAALWKTLLRVDNA